MAYFVSELKSLEKDEVTGVTSAAVPSPWFSPRMVESPHPVRDDFQFCKTVVLPGASCLYLKFDPRCATQYEYDKVRHGPVIPLLCYVIVMLCSSERGLIFSNSGWKSSLRFLVIL